MEIILKLASSSETEDSLSLTAKDLSPELKEAILFEEILRRQKKLDPKKFSQKKVKIKK